MEIKVSTVDAAKQRTACIVVGVHSGTRDATKSAARLDAASGGAFSKTIRHLGMTGKAGQTLLLADLPGVAAQRTLVVGGGKKGEADLVKFRSIVKQALAGVHASGARDAVMLLGELEIKDASAYAKARQSVEGVREGAYRFDQMKGDGNGNSDRERPALKRVLVGVSERADKAATERGVAHGAAIANGTALARDLGNLPGNVCTPSYLADHARQLARRHKSLSVRVRGENDMKKLGMGSLLSVAQGSREPAKFITLEYKSAKRSAKPVVLVGKGVTFDSGGISIKPSAAMDEMKFDMCGAASVLGTMQCLAELGLALNVVGIIPATENLPGGAAIKPGDIVTSMSGQTIEILNTDAEGRLILCDALTFAARYKPDVVIDIATLTGACVIALGAHATGLFANDEKLAETLLEAGRKSCDRAWQMPLWEDYDKQLKSNFADIANVGGRQAGAVTAARFLARFAKALRWAHLDIAGTAWHSGDRKGATGRPVMLLAQYLLDRAGGHRGE